LVKAPSLRSNQILPKSLPAPLTQKHGWKKIAAKMELLNERMNYGQHTTLQHNVLTPANSLSL